MVNIKRIKEQMKALKYALDIEAMTQKDYESLMSRYTAWLGTEYIAKLLMDIQNEN